MQSELKTCPFCGSEKHMLLLPTCDRGTPYDPADRAFPIIRCGGCYADVPGKDFDASGKSAVDAWNRRSALVDVPAVEPVGEATTMVANSGVVAGFTVAAFPADKVPAGTKLYTSPPLSREGEDSAEVAAKARTLATAILQHFAAMEDGDGNEAPELAMARDLLAATRSASATTQNGGDHG